MGEPPGDATRYQRGIVVVAGYPGADMRAGTLSQVLKQAGLTENTESGDGTN